MPPMQALIEQDNMLKVLSTINGVAACWDADLLIGELFTGLTLSEKLGIPFLLPILV